MRQVMKNFLSTAVLAVIVLAIIYGVYRLERRINWNFGGYESRVEQKIREMVREEALK